MSEKDETAKIAWEETGKTATLWKGPIFDVDQAVRRSPRGEEHPFVVCRCPDWVTVVPELTDREGRTRFLMVRQFRHGSGRLSLEFPAGVVDPGEEPLEAALRELREETGFRAAEMIPIGRINPNPAFMTNSSWTFLARGLEGTGRLDLDEQEFIQGCELSREELERRMGRGEMHSAIMVQAWFWYGEFLAGRPNEADFSGK